jgi:hypothetical protein
MKTLLFVIAMVISMARSQATVLTLDGDLNWNITEPRCSFQLRGKLQNNSGFGSGTLKLVLWATPYTFPSAGYIVGQYTIGDLPSGYQFSNFTFKTPSNVPAISGSYNFTIAIAEYNGGTWRNIMAIPTGKQKLQVGNFVNQAKWKVPVKTILPPVSQVSAGNFFQLVLKSTDELNEFPVLYRDKTTITINTPSKLTSTLRSINTPATYKYTTKTGKLNKKLVTFSNLAIDYGSKGKGVYTQVYSFYFQSPSSGTYKCVEKNTSGTETTWGSFNLY